MRWARLRYFARVQSGITIDASRDQGDRAEERPYLRVANVQAGWLDLDEVKSVSVPPFLADRATLIPGDVLMTEGGDLDKLGRGTVWHGQIPGCLHQNHIFAVRPHPGRLDPDYLALLTQTSHARSYFESTGVKTTNLASTSSSKILDLPIPVLSMDRQRAIVDFLEGETTRIDGLIAAKRRLVDLAYERMQSTISEITAAAAVARPHDVALPPVWRMVMLRRCFADVDYGIGDATQPAGRIGVLGMTNVHGGKIVGNPAGYVDDVDPKLLLRPGDLLFNRTNSVGLVAKVGRVVEVDGPTTFASYLVRLRPSSLTNSRYLAYLLNSPEVLSLARSTALPSIGQANLNPNRYSGIRVPLPPPPQQESIVAELDQHDAWLTRLGNAIARQIALLQEHRQALITAAVTDELVIPRAAA